MTLLALAVALATFVAFIPALQNDFLGWDDVHNIIENENFRGLGPSQLKWMFTTCHMGPYQPLSWMTLAGDYLVWGLSPFGYHLTNAVLHAVNASLLFLVTLALLNAGVPGRGVPGRTPAICAAFAALFYSLHPLRVESVAWVTERRDVLCGFFVLVSVLLYLKACVPGLPAKRRRRRLIGAILAYAGSLLAKASSMTLPVVLLVLDVYPLRRVSGQARDKRRRRIRDVLVEKIPFFLLALVIAVVAVAGQRDARAFRSFEGFGLLKRLAVVAHGVVLYVGKTVAPNRLLPLYELDPTLDPLAARYVCSALGALGITVGLWVFRRRFPAALAAWVSYLALLAPTSGIAQAGPQIAADRYTYLSGMALAVLAGAILFGLYRLVERRGRGPRSALLALAGVVLAVLGVYTWGQCRVWRDSETLWEYVLSQDPNSGIAHLNLGTEYRRQGEPGRAIPEYEAAIAVGRYLDRAHLNLGRAYLETGDLDAATDQFRRSIACAPRKPRGHLWLGEALFEKGRTRDALAEWERGAEIAPDLPQAHHNLGRAYHALGDHVRAEACYRRAMALGDPEARAKLGVVLLEAGRTREAMAELREAVRRNPDNVPARRSLATAYVILGDAPAAVREYEALLRVDPEDAFAHYGLALVLHQTGDAARARRHLEKALSLGFEPPPGSDAFLRDVRGE